MKSNGQPRLILFDIDGTLLRTHGAGIRSIENAIMQVTGGKIVKRIDASGRIDPYIIRDYCKLNRIPLSPRNLKRIIAVYPRLLKKELTRVGGLLMPGVLSLLKKLKKRKNIYLGLATGNLIPGARIKLKFLGIDKYFLGGGFGNRRSDRTLIVRDAIKSLSRKCRVKFNRAGTRPCRVVVIGDTPHDVVSGRENGCFTIGVATGRFSVVELKKHKPDLVIRNLEHPGILRILLSA